jgi:outer membrane protein TolC
MAALNQFRRARHGKRLPEIFGICSTRLDELTTLPDVSNRRALRMLTAWCPAAVLVALVAVAGCKTYQARPLAAAATAAALEARTLDAPALRAFLETNLPTTLPAWPPVVWSFSELTLVAFYYHPSLEVARAQWAVAQAGLGTAGGRPNPVLSATPGYSANAPAGLSPWFPAVTLDVPIETAGKRAHRIATAEHLSEAARLNVLSAAWQVRSQLRTALGEADFARGRVALLGRQVEMQGRLVGLLEQRLAAGAVAATEITPARIARLKTQSELTAARQQLAAARVQLAQALGLPVKAIEALQLAPQPPLPPASAAEFLSAAVRDRALQGRPDVLAALAEYAASESALHLEIAKQYPDVHLAPGYQFDQGEHKWSLGLSLELPVLNRNQGPIAEALARRDEAGARFLAVQARVLGEIDRAAQGHAAVAEQMQSSESLLAAQRRQADALAAARQAGAADTLDVAAAQLEAATAELAVLDAQNRTQQALGQLEDALQIPFDALDSVTQSRAVSSMKDPPL